MPVQAQVPVPVPAPALVLVEVQVLVRIQALVRLRPRVRQAGLLAAPAFGHHRRHMSQPAQFLRRTKCRAYAKIART